MLPVSWNRFLFFFEVTNILSFNILRIFSIRDANSLTENIITVY
jgi:hypothetical protein